MIDDSNNILDTFNQYAKTFESLNPLSVLSFYHYPAILISPDKVVTVKNWIEGFVVFTAVMAELKFRGYAYSETESLSVDQLSDRLATVKGIVIRFKENKQELERFGLAYTMRQEKDGWKIVVGALYELETSA
ncbi:hypothetical protein NDA01_17865 [Trichocoleus desertorum AS-A10]|uniref:DUF6841 family protein n=1 Tax=Trichocoleus desertorum TaxID=1481672 RepID=UPI0032973230